MIIFNDEHGVIWLLILPLSNVIRPLHSFFLPHVIRVHLVNLIIDDLNRRLLLSSLITRDSSSRRWLIETLLLDLLFFLHWCRR